MTFVNQGFLSSESWTTVVLSVSETVYLFTCTWVVKVTPRFLLNHCYSTLSCFLVHIQLYAPFSSRGGGVSGQWSTKTGLLSGERVCVCVWLCVSVLCTCTPPQIVRRPSQSRAVSLTSSTRGASWKPNSSRRPLQGPGRQRAFLWAD